MNNYFNYDIISSFYKIEKKFLKTFVNSIKNQYPLIPNHIIIVDDKKNISFYQYLKSQINSKIKIIIIKNFINLGQSFSLNKAIDKTCSKFIFRLDIDDYWIKGHVQNAKNFFLKNKNYPFYSELSWNLKTYGINYKDYLILDNPTIHSSWVVNSKIKKFKYDSKKPGDYSLLSRIIRYNQVYFSKTFYVKYYDNIRGLSKTKSANKDIFKIQIENLNFNLKKSVNIFHKLKYYFFFILLLLKNIKQKLL